MVTPEGGYGGGEWRTLAHEHLDVEYAVFCMEPARLSVVFAYIPSMGQLKAAPLGRLLFTSINLRL